MVFKYECLQISFVNIAQIISFVLKTETEPFITTHSLTQHLIFSFMKLFRTMNNNLEHTFRQLNKCLISYESLDCRNSNTTHYDYTTRMFFHTDSDKVDKE